MIKNKGFLFVSLIAIMAVSPAFSDTTATREWVKSQIYDKYLVPQGNALNTINNRLATDVRDKIYTYDTDKNSPTYRQVLDPLNTEAETAFSGINEVLEKVDGNNGTSGSAVQLETTAQNAYGAINELKGEISGKAAQADLQTLNNKVNNATTGLDSKAAQADLQTLTNKVNNASTGLDTKASKAELEALSQTIDGLQGNTYGGSNGVRVTGNTVGLSVTPEAGEMYIYTSNGWQKLQVEDTWN